MSVVFHVKLLNILGFVHLPEKVLVKYFEIKGDLNLIACSIFWGEGGTFVRLFNFSIQQLKDRRNSIVSPNIKSNIIFTRMRGMCFITHSSIFQFIALLFYNIVIHVADLLIMFCFCNKYFLLMNICLSFVLYYFQKLSSWIIYKVHVHVHILPNQDWLVPEFSTFSILILICYYWSGWSASRTETTP